MQEQELVPVETAKKRGRKPKIEFVEEAAPISQEALDSLDVKPVPKDRQRRLKMFDTKDYKIIPMVSKFHNEFHPNGVFAYAFTALYRYQPQKMQKHKQFIMLSKKQFRALLADRYKMNKMIGMSQADRIAYLKKLSEEN